MATLVYRDYFIVASSRFDQGRNCWDLWVFVKLPNDNGSRTLDPSKSEFETQKEAEDFGIELAKRWVDERETK